MGSVEGYILDENAVPLAGVQVSAGDRTGLTDEYGYFRFQDVLLPQAGGTVRVSRTGYFEACRSFSIQAARNAFVQVKMLRRTVTGIVDATTGGQVSTTEGARVELPAQGVVVAGSGAPYSGNVHVSARLIDPSSNGGLLAAIPGDARALNKEGKLRFAASLGMLAIELHGDAGQLLQIATGREAALTIPIPSALQGAAPQSISLWSLDEAKGFWKEESTAVRNGNNYTGKVSHFSFWEAAVGLPVVTLRAQVLNSSLQPLAHTPVMVTPAGVPWMSGYGRFGYTDAGGYLQAVVPASSNLVLDVVTPCASPVFSHPISTGTSDIDLGAIHGNAGQGAVVLQGTVLDCNNDPVTDGYVQVYDRGFNHRIPVVNGAFSFTGIACVNTPVSYVAVDRTSNQQSQPQIITLTGQHNLGTLTACGVSSVATITYVIDGASVTISEPALQPAGYLATPANEWTQVLIIGGNQSSNPDVTFQFDGGNAVGSGHKIYEVFSKGFISGRAIAPVPLTLTITEYGDIGGFIRGSFSGLMLDFGNNTPYNFSCQFRVKRNN